MTDSTDNLMSAKELLIAVCEQFQLVKKMKWNLEEAERNYNTARTLALKQCKKEKFTGTYVRGVTIVCVHNQTINIDIAEILE